MINQRILLTLLLMFEIVFKVQAIKQHLIYKKSSSQIIQQNYISKDFKNWLFFINNQGTKLIKKANYKKLQNSVQIKSLVFKQNMFSLKGFNQRDFNYLLIANQAEDQITQYYTVDQLATYATFYEIGQGIIPDKNDLYRIQISDFGILLVNQKVIYYGYAVQENKGWQKIIALTDNFAMLLASNGIYIAHGDPMFSGSLGYEILLNITLSIQYKCTPYIYRTGVYDNSDPFSSILVRYFKKIVIYCYKQNKNQTLPGYDWFVRSYLHSNKYSKGVQVDQINGQSLQIPIFQVSKKLQKFVIIFKSLNETQTMIIKQINYNDLLFEDLKIPQKIRDNDVSIYLNDYHVYVRSKIIKNQKYEFYVFVILNGQFILLKKSQLSPNQVLNLVSTSIIYETTKESTFFDEQPYDVTQTLQRKLSSLQLSAPKLLHFYKNQTDYFYTQEQFLSLKDMQVQENRRMNNLQYLNSKDNNGLDIIYFKDVYEAKRIYAYQPDKNINKTLIVLESFILNISVNISIDGIFQIIDISKGKQNCILAKDTTSTLLSIIFNETQQKLQILQIYKYQKSFLDFDHHNYKSIQHISPRCESFINEFASIKKLYRRKVNSLESPIYEKDAFIKQQQSRYIQFGQNQFFNIFRKKLPRPSLEKDQFKLFERNVVNNEYREILSEQELQYYQSENFLIVDESSTKILIISSTFYVNKLILISKINNQWKLIKNDFQLHAYVYSLKHSLSPNFQIVVFQYSGKISQRQTRNFLVLHVNYGLGTVINLTNSTKILTQEYEVQGIYFKVSNNYLYIRNTTNQYLFKLSKEGLGYHQIVMQNRIGLQYQSYLSKQSVIINQSISGDGQVSLIYYIDQQELYSKDTLNVRTPKNDMFNSLYNIRGKIYDSQNDKLYSCIPGCQYCFNRNWCRKCSDGYYMIFQTKLCLKCEQNCKTCTFDKPSICLSCFPSYVLVGSVCKKCHVSCFQCSRTIQSKCASCDIGKTLIEQSKLNKICLQCSENCIYCSSRSICIQCDTGFTVDKNGKCVACPLSCSKCDSIIPSSCISCKMGFYMEKAENNFENIRCMKCSDNCKACNSSTNCFQCINSYRLKKDQSSILNSIQDNKSKTKCVVKCQFPCKECTQTNSNECISCAQGYIYNKTSRSCDFDLNCNAFYNCTVCPYQYNLINNFCYSCLSDVNCDSCYKFNFTLCMTCKKGYYLLQNECLLCASECQQCIIQNICTKCKSGYVRQDDLQASRCIKCSNNCLTCIITPANCVTCNQNMKLQGSRCISNAKVYFNMTLKYDFQLFSNRDYERISSQIALKTGKTLEQVTITQVKREGISTAIQGYILINNQQDQILTSKNYEAQFDQGLAIDKKIIISRQYFGTLTICPQGSYSYKNECFQCQNTCSACTSFSVCTKCTTGYFLKGQKCIVCSKDCKTCDFSPSNCQSCNQNLELYRGRCIPNISIIFKMTLNYDYKSFNYLDSQGILNEVALKTGKSRQKIILTQKRQGSVTMIGIIFADDQEDQKKTLQTLRKQFGQGSVIDNKEVTASSYTGIIAETASSSQSGVNIKLILGIVIPSAIVIGLIIFFLVFRVRKLHQQNKIKEEMEQRSSQSGASQYQRQKRRLQRAAKRNKRNLPDSQKITADSATNFQKSEFKTINI